MNTRECFGDLVERNITRRHLIDELDRLAVDRGYPAVLRCGSGPELACAAMADWAGERVGLHFIPPGQPWRNGYIQLGLQFFPDRDGALREMKRVLVPNGRAVVMVWREIDHAHAFAVLAAALGRTIGSDAETLMRAPFTLGDDCELSRLLEAAALCDCAIRAEIGTVRFASAATFVRSYIGGSPLAATVAAAPAPAYDELVVEVERALDPLLEHGSLCFPIEAHLALRRA
jgi:SAM-dependent methyltransferase